MRFITRSSPNPLRLSPCWYVAGYIRGMASTRGSRSPCGRRFPRRTVAGWEGQFPDRSGRVGDPDVRVSVHRHRDGGVPGEFLRVFGLNPGFHQFGDEPVPQGMKVGGSATRVSEGEEIAQFAFLLFLGRLPFSHPLLSCGSQVAFNQPPCRIVLRPLPGPKRS